MANMQISYAVSTFSISVTCTTIWFPQCQCSMMHHGNQPKLMILSCQNKVHVQQNCVYIFGTYCTCHALLFSNIWHVNEILRAIFGCWIQVSPAFQTIITRAIATISRHGNFPHYVAKYCYYSYVIYKVYCVVSVRHNDDCQYYYIITERLHHCNFDRLSHMYI